MSGLEQKSEPEKRSELQKVVQELEHSITTLADRVGVLVDKLKPVTRQIPDSPEKELVEKGYAIEVAQTLKSKINAIFQVVKVIDKQISNLEV